METLADTARIIVFLKRLLEQRVLITVRIADHAQGFATAIIKLSSDHNGYLILDELRPRQGHDLLKLTPTIRVSALLDGVTLDFNSTVTTFGEEDGIAYYKLAIPKLLNYFQRRESIRIPLSATISMPATLTTADNLILKGNIADLSIGGIRIRFNKDLPKNIEPDQLMDCSFLLPADNKQPFTCEVRVRAIKGRHESHKAAFIGGQFVGISNIQERQIERCVMLLQRTAQQKRNS